MNKLRLPNEFVLDFKNFDGPNGPDDVMEDLYLTDDGTVYFLTFKASLDLMGRYNTRRLYVKDKGETKYAELPGDVAAEHVYGDSLHVEVKENNDERHKFYKVKFIPTEGFIIHFLRQQQNNERSISYSKKGFQITYFGEGDTGERYVHRIGDDPIKGKVNESCHESLKDAEPFCIYRGQLVYLNKKNNFLGTKKASVVKVSDETFLLEIPRAYKFLHTAHYRDSSPLTFVNNFREVYVINMETLTVLPTLCAPKDMHIYVQGIYGNILYSTCFIPKNGFKKMVHMTAQLPVGYYIEANEGNSEDATLKQDPRELKEMPIQEKNEFVKPKPIPQPMNEEPNRRKNELAMPKPIPQQMNEEPNRRKNQLAMPKPIPQPANNPVNAQLPKEIPNKILTTPNVYSSRFANEFIVKDSIGSGGFGTVFKVQNKFDKCEYAIKRVVVDDLDFTLSEVQILARLDHPGIVRYYATWMEKQSEDGQNNSSNTVFVCIQMQLCKYSLYDWLKRRNSPSDRPLFRMISWIKQITSAIAYVHAQNLIHRDLKPANILFADNDVLKVCDLGLATERRREDVQTSYYCRSKAGTESYMSPEQNSGKPYSSTTDVFALGLIFIEFLVILSSTTKYKLFDDIRKGKTVLPTMDPIAKTFVRKLIRKNPQERPTCQEMLQDAFLA